YVGPNVHAEAVVHILPALGRLPRVHLRRRLRGQGGKCGKEGTEHGEVRYCLLQLEVHGGSSNSLCWGRVRQALRSHTNPLRTFAHKPTAGRTQAHCGGRNAAGFHSFAHAATHLTAALHISSLSATNHIATS